MSANPSVPNAVPKPAPITPTAIREALGREVLGQEDALAKVALAVHKHLVGARGANLLLIGNSGTGKTTIMKALDRYYRQTPGLKAFGAVAVLNANLLVDAERLEFRPERLLSAIEQRARAELGGSPTAEQLKATIERATVCIDEIDKMSARLAGRANPVGIALQQGLLTLMEGGQVPLRCRVRNAAGAESVETLEIDTSGMLFVCGGAFEELYDQVYQRVCAPGSAEKLKSTMVRSAEGELRFETRFSLPEFFRIEDLFDYGMVPQFTSRFDSVLVLAELSRQVLEQILLLAPDAPFQRSRRYFEALGVELVLEPQAAALLAEQSERNARMGARALRPAFGRVIAPLEFDPWNSGALEAKLEGGFRLTISAQMVRTAS